MTENHSTPQPIMRPAKPEEISEDIRQVIIPDTLLPAFEEWLSSRGLYMSGPWMFSSEDEPDKEETPTHFVWIKQPK